MKPGEMMMVGPEGVTLALLCSAQQTQSSCIFEHVYFSRPDSNVFGRWVQESAARRWAGSWRSEAPADADIVVPVPDSGVTAAMGYSAESGIPFRFGLIRNHYVGRTFIEPEQSVRDFGVKLKLNPVRSLLEGKRVILIDDSIVRGTTSRKIVRMVRSAGAKEVHMRISCPPTISPCFYGVDTPSKEPVDRCQQERGRDPQVHRRRFACLSFARGIEESLRRRRELNFCSACYTGNYPTEWVDVADIAPAPAIQVCPNPVKTLGIIGGLTPDRRWSITTRSLWPTASSGPTAAIRR